MISDAAFRRYRHGHCAFGKRSNIHDIWVNMKQRCLNPKSKPYKYYGARGIKVCDRWAGEDGFLHFLNDMGDRPSHRHTLDRIDNDGDYEPSNCRWATWDQQNANKRIMSRQLKIHDYICIFCQKSFSRESRGKLTLKYCSPECKKSKKMIVPITC
jgi:hypothetical protein